MGLTPLGRAQAEAAGEALAGHLAAGDTVQIFHSPVHRVEETAEVICYRLLAEPVSLHSPLPDPALENVRFVEGTAGELKEPSLLYTELSQPAYLRTLPPARAEYYRGFWGSRDPMGYWLTRESHGGAETPQTVLARLLGRLNGIFAEAESGDGPLPFWESECTHWVLVTHSGAMRALLRHALGADPGEPNFCEIIVVEPGEQPGEARLTYRGRETRVSTLPDVR